MEIFAYVLGGIGLAFCGLVVYGMYLAIRRQIRRNSQN